MGTIEIAGRPFDLESAHFGCSQPIGVGELRKLRELTRLESASFPGSGLDDEGLGHVCAVPTIENLNLQDTRVTDAGLAQLSRLPRLRHLRLKENPQLTNACVGHLVRVPSLIDLQVHETSIDRHGLEALVALRKLADLLVSVRDGNHSFASLLELSVRMPWCTILAKSRGTFEAGTFSGEWR